MDPHAVKSARDRIKPEEGTLRWLVEKWLWPTQVAPARVTRFGRTTLDRTRFVCLEAWRQERLVALLFFRHIDGTWHVFPPQTRHPTMRMY
jgi:hypothetical protein